MLNTGKKKSNFTVKHIERIFALLYRSCTRQYNKKKHPLATPYLLSPPVFYSPCRRRRSAEGSPTDAAEVVAVEEDGVGDLVGVVGETTETEQNEAEEVQLQGTGCRLQFAMFVSRLSRQHMFATYPNGIERIQHGDTQGWNLPLIQASDCAGIGGIE